MDPHKRRSGCVTAPITRGIASPSLPRAFAAPLAHDPLAREIVISPPTARTNPTRRTAGIPNELLLPCSETESAVLRHALERLQEGQRLAMVAQTEAAVKALDAGLDALDAVADPCVREREEMGLLLEKAYAHAHAIKCGSDAAARRGGEAAKRSDYEAGALSALSGIAGGTGTASASEYEHVWEVMFAAHNCIGDGRNRFNPRLYIAYCFHAASALSLGLYDTVIQVAKSTATTAPEQTARFVGSLAATARERQQAARTSNATLAEEIERLSAAVGDDGAALRQWRQTIATMLSTAEGILPAGSGTGVAAHSSCLPMSPAYEPCL